MRAELTGVDLVRLQEDVVAAQHSTPHKANAKLETAGDTTYDTVLQWSRRYRTAQILSKCCRSDSVSRCRILMMSRSATATCMNDSLL